MESESTGPSQHHQTQNNPYIQLPHNAMPQKVFSNPPRMAILDKKEKVKSKFSYQNSNLIKLSVCNKLEGTQEQIKDISRNKQKSPGEWFFPQRKLTLFSTSQWNKKREWNNLFQIKRHLGDLTKCNILTSYEQSNCKKS